MSERLLKIEDVARDYLQIARTRVYELVGSGEIESIVIGRSRRVPESAVQAYIDRQRAEQSGDPAAEPNR
jgi:excisionase family DNA binding protein